ncbi:MAG: hypothetical protein LBV54_01595, partial [Puniceicoccales bacterium]|nr:hypothetical protein [Puniceicoccales bacterium]
MPFRKIFRWMRRRNVVGEVPPVLEAKYPALAIVISPPDAFPDEQKIVTRLFDAGLSRFHLRKPEWTPARL